MASLFTPLKIRNTILKNRLGVSPMCMYSSTDGFATDFHLVHLGSRASGGFGLIMQEATAVSPEGRITINDLGLWKEEHQTQLHRIVNFCHSQNTLTGIQLAHAGRKGSHRPPHEDRKPVPPDQAKGWQTVSPSALSHRREDPLPLALDKTGIEKVKTDFVTATQRAREIGYDVLEIHAAHGYLLHQFYSPLSNQRTDQYGGSFENRIRLLLEITTLVKKEWGSDKPLFVRISATDWTENGWTLTDSIALAKRLKEKGVDLIDTSSGGNISGVTIPNKPGYQVKFAEQIKKQADILTSAVGLITTAEQTENILKENKADLVFYGREALRQPYLPLTITDHLQDSENWPVQYLRAR